MKVTKQYIRSLIRESLEEMGGMQQKPQPMAEVAGKKVFFVGLREAYEADLVYGVFDNLAAAKKALQKLEASAKNMTYSQYSLWSYTVTNTVNQDGIDPDYMG